ncbi:General transcription factor 3C polypeptide 1 [Chionoecetes opilio]|uniref:General transcription factor 3C polypeptide 1 n=1 Tax=Chionoecetes opilio TaxID=41210 RepID=A0A8J4XRI9_CHIOP|nr:General transcription factor 3C polypeptide 1 [Chionoecetes opilio]
MHTSSNEDGDPECPHRSLHILLSPDPPPNPCQIKVPKTVEASLMEGVEVNMEVVAAKKGRKKKHETATSPMSSSATAATPTSDPAKPGDKTLVPEKEMYSEGFLRLVKEIKITHNNQKRSSPHVTTRMMRRANMIIEAVRSARVIDDAFRLQKMIVQVRSLLSEAREGYAVKMDKKSLDRLLDKLAKGGFLRNIIVKLKSKTTTLKKNMRYVIHPSITFGESSCVRGGESMQSCVRGGGEDNPQLISTIEQQKLKFLVAVNDPKKDGEGGTGDKKSSGGKKVKNEEKGDASLPLLEGKGKGESDAAMESVGESMHQLKLMHHGATSKAKRLEEAASSSVDSYKKFFTLPISLHWSWTGCCGAPVTSPVYSSLWFDSPLASPQLVVVKGSLGPKFVRMCELHKLLFYLVYGYEGREDVCQEDAWVTIAAASPEINLQNEDMTEYPSIYCTELSWKMFIPPLPKHLHTDTSWAFVCDILLRLPLCIFIRLVSISFTSEELENFLSHPLKKNMLVRYLPNHLRRSLLQGRRYVTYVMDLINRLCYMGLVQYGQQIMKEKDQVFIYLNRQASLIDSTTSSPGYHQICADKEYVRKEYNFLYLHEIVQYWYDLWTISMHTPLGGHNCIQGKKITIQILDRKPQIMETLTARTTSEAPLRDIGTIPGDGRGAGGLDSAMFAHLKRNWSYSSGKSAAARPSAILPPASVGGEKSSCEGAASYSQYLLNTTNPTLDTLSPKHRLAGLRNVKLSVYKPRLGSEGKGVDVMVGLVPRQPRGRKGRQSSTSETQPRVSRGRGGYGRGARPSCYLRVLKQRKKSPKKPYYDEEDRAALRRMSKL